MEAANFGIIILIIACMAMLVLAKWFDQRYYIPMLKKMHYYKRDHVDAIDDNLIRLGLIAASGGTIIFVLIGLIWRYVVI